MKKRICLILTITLLLPAILLGRGLSLPSYYADTYYAELPELYSRLQNTEGKKIVIIGGSNVAFGVDSADLEASLREHGFDYTVCNFGLYAAVGTSAMLSLSEDSIHEGDLVVLAIEPIADTFSSYFGAEAMLKCAEDNPGLLLSLNSDQKAAVVGSYISYLQDRTEICRTGILPKAEGAYAKAAFDENGDMIYDRAGNTMPLGYDTAAAIDLANLTCEDAFAEQINQYIQSAQKKGASVVMSFSPMNRSAVTDTSENTLYRFFRYLSDTFDCSVISDPNNYIMDSGWFYDSNFHLNSAGASVRTHQLLLDLLTWLGCSDKVTFEMPGIPASIAQTTESETDTGDFLYEETGESGLSVVGLTAQGMTKASLTLPSAIDGKTVVELAPDFLGNDSNLIDLTLPSSIERIPDGLFSGCSNLSSITLLHQETIPTVGKNLLDGTEGLTIYVTREAYSLYRDGAGCAANNWELYLDHLVILEAGEN